MKIKSGVQLRGLQPQMVLAATIAYNVIAIEYKRDFVITSGSEGKHKKNSLHYSGNAIDIRSRHLGHIWTDEVVKKLKDNLGEEFDVVTGGNHIHIEYQPEGE